MSSSRAQMSGKVQTVLGEIDADSLGITLTHEHLLASTDFRFVEPADAGARRLAHMPVCPENISWLRHNEFGNPHNMRLLDEDEAIEEVMHFKKEGGGTIVEVSNVGMGRDPQGLARISRVTGLNVVMGSGYYVGQAQAPEVDARSEQEMAEEIVADIEVGVGGTGIRAGIIGEIGASWPLSDREGKSLRAAVRAQQQTGAAIVISQVSGTASSLLEAIRTLDSAGADVSRVVASHIDRRVLSLSERLELARTGCYLGYDLFGRNDLSASSSSASTTLCDRERIEQIIELIEAGHLARVLMAHDHCLKTQLLRYGGDGYAHILRTVVPQMVARGLRREQIDVILVENPKRLLQMPA